MVALGSLSLGYLHFGVKDRRGGMEVARFDHSRYDNGDVKIFDLPGASAESAPTVASPRLAKREADQYLEMGHQRSQWSLPPAICRELSGDIFVPYGS